MSGKKKEEAPVDPMLLEKINFCKSKSKRYVENQIKSQEQKKDKADKLYLQALKMRLSELK